jgi:Ca2+-binding RTX toxin-like protein
VRVFDSENNLTFSATDLLGDSADSKSYVTGAKLVGQDVAVIAYTNWEGGYKDTEDTEVQFVLVDALTKTSSAPVSVAVALGTSYPAPKVTALDNDAIIGDDGDDRLFGNAGHDLLDGGTGLNALHGGTGNDRYLVGVASDLVVEAVGEGSDAVFAALDYTLTEGIEVELLRTKYNNGVGNIDLTDNALSQTIVGNAGKNILDGTFGAPDVLRGLDGNDTSLP